MTARNVLFITLDQWRADCLSAADHPVVKTPNLDALAQRGVRFANHWSVTAPCGPSRASLYTGLYSMNHRGQQRHPLDHGIDNIARLARRHGYDPTLFGYTDTTVDPRTVTDPADPRLFSYEGLLPGFTPGLKLAGEAPLEWLAWLQSHGYTVPSVPEEIFEAAPWFPGAQDHPDMWAPTVFGGEHTVTAFLNEAIFKWLDSRDDQPWFAHVSYLRPHPPYRAPMGYQDLYDPNSGEPFRRLGDRDQEVAMHPLHAAAVHITGCDLDEANARQTRAAYWANMAEVDFQLGRLLEQLRANGQEDDTLIVVTSDHGDQMGDHWLVEKLGWWDESFHVPLIVVDPRSEADATRASVVHAPTESVDVMPTIANWLGAEVPVAVDGRELQAFLHGHPTPHDWRDAVHWQWDFRDPRHHLAEEAFGLTMEECTLDVIRTADAKYVQFANGSSLAFDLVSDPFGLVDRSSDPSFLAQRVELMTQMLTWRQRHDDRTLTGHVVTEDGLFVRRDPRR